MQYTQVREFFLNENGNMIILSFATYISICLPPKLQTIIALLLSDVTLRLFLFFLYRCL